ncbi:MAG: Vms1/Ankzf1 family peptidyl-tRNA hydrolase [Haloarculaceae archaeon]
MLDKLLGRARLKARIDELESENERLENQFEAESERRRDAVSARQEAEERVNRLEDRIADLEGRLEHTGGEGERLDFRHSEACHGERVGAVLDRLTSVEIAPESLLTAMVAESAPDPVADLLGAHSALVDRAAPCLVVADDAGLVATALDPVVAPDPFCTWSDRADLDRSWFEPTGAFALALVRSDLFAVGVYEGRSRERFEGFESDVKGRHSKGGFSQARFERRRDEQVAAHVEKCEATLDDLGVDPLYVVGQETLLDEFADRAAATAAVDATGDPREALDTAFREFWTVRVWGL